MSLDSKKFLKQLFCFHVYKEIAFQRTKHTKYGFAGAELPGYRAIEKCQKCGKLRVTNLNPMTPTKDLYNNSLWEDT